jgi:hypothetical protein
MTHQSGMGSTQIDSLIVAKQRPLATIGQPGNRVRAERNNNASQPGRPVISL